VTHTLTDEQVDAALQAVFDGWKSGAKTALVNATCREDPEFYRAHQAAVEAHADFIAQALVTALKSDRVMYEDARDRLIARLNGELPTISSFQVHRHD
jgi:hypothetical protein